jgi:hypothetical protein
MRDHPELDQFTAFWFAKRYKFLNTHYLPQFHWLVNLSQYLNDNTKLQFHNINSLKQITEYHFTPPGVTPVSTEFTEKLLDNNNLKVWLYLDQILLELQKNTLLKSILTIQMFIQKIYLFLVRWKEREYSQSNNF